MVLQANAEQQRHDDIEKLAYSYWQERGCPFGTPEIDWFRAEEALSGAGSHDKEDLLVSAARLVGGALGEIAAAVRL